MEKVLFGLEVFSLFSTVLHLVCKNKIHIYYNFLSPKITTVGSINHIRIAYNNNHNNNMLE
jgi:hypothetical protein